MPKDVLVRLGSSPYEDGSGFSYSFDIDREYIWVNGGAVMINLSDWEDFKSAVDRGLEAFKKIHPEKGS